MTVLVSEVKLLEGYCPCRLSRQGKCHHIYSTTVTALAGEVKLLEGYCPSRLSRQGQVASYAFNNCERSGGQLHRITSPGLRHRSHRMFILCILWPTVGTANGLHGIISTYLGRVKLSLRMYCRYALLFHRPVWHIVESGWLSADSCVALPTWKEWVPCLPSWSPQYTKQECMKFANSVLVRGFPDRWRIRGPLLSPRAWT